MDVTPSKEELLLSQESIDQEFGEIKNSEFCSHSSGSINKRDGYLELEMKI